MVRYQLNVITKYKQNGWIEEQGFDPCTMNTRYIQILSRTSVISVTLQDFGPYLRYLVHKPLLPRI